jgi:hypothetical protein
MRGEYLVKFHGGDEVVTNVQLGPIPGVPRGATLTTAETRALGIFRRKADALVLRGDKAIIIEFALLPSPGDISLVELYGRLFRVTPDYPAAGSMALQLQIVGAIEDPVLSSMSRERGIDFVLFQPAWLPEYLALLAARKRTASASV